MDKVPPRVVEEAVRKDEAERALQGLAPERRARDVEAAKLLTEIDAACHWAYRGCSGVAHYGETLGFSAREALALARAGRAFGLCPELEERVLACRISIDAAAALEPLLVIGILAEHYLDSFDKRRKKRRKRRMPSTEIWPGRSIPEEVQEAIAGRYGDKCRVPGCGHEIFLEFAHLIPHKDGGSREVWNLIYVCRCHHKLIDNGKMSVEGTADRPIFRDADGRVIEEEPRAPP